MNLKEILAELKKNWIAAAILTIVLGMIMLFFPGLALQAGCYTVGGVTIAMGVTRVVRYFQQDHTHPFIFQSDLVAGLLTLGLGIFIITNSKMVMGLVPTIFGVLLIGCGIGNILRAVDARRSGYSAWGLLLGLAILTIALGWVIIGNPFVTLEVAVSVIGGGLIYEGITDLAISRLVGGRIESWRKTAGR